MTFSIVDDEVSTTEPETVIAADDTANILINKMIGGSYFFDW